MREPRDAYWQLGRVVLGHASDARRTDLASHARGWVIKAFYLPLFVVFTHNQVGGILTYELAGMQASNMRLYHFLSEGIYALDVLYATVGYVLSMRVFDTHLRSAEPTMKSTLALAGVSTIYSLRARTEERHLSRNPVYVAYALWMKEHGLLRVLNQVPFLRYRAPAPAVPPTDA